MIPTRNTIRTRGTRLPILNRGMIAENGYFPEPYKFIQDTMTFKLTTKPKLVMTEDISGKKINIMNVSGLFQQCNKVNSNKRIYERDVLAGAVKAILEDIPYRKVLGEMDHPSDAKIHMDRISHVVTDLTMDNDQVYGKAEILCNQFHGAALRGLFERKCQVGISSRGVGDMEMRESAGEQVYYVLPGYTLVTWDAVVDPSVSGANLTVMEGLNRKVKPIHEAKRKNLLDTDDYERILIETVNKYFDIKPLPGNEKKRKKTYFI